MLLEAEYLGTRMTWNAYTRSELCSRTGCVEVVIQEQVAGKHKLSAAPILALVLGMPALELLGFAALSSVAPVHITLLCPPPPAVLHPALVLCPAAQLGAYSLAEGLRP